MSGELTPIPKLVSGSAHYFLHFTSLRVYFVGNAKSEESGLTNGSDKKEESGFADSDGWDVTDDNGFGASTNDSNFGSNRDFGGRPREKGCFNCKKEGHMSRECPESRKGRDRGDRRCHKCGEDGHFARECDKRGQNIDEITDKDWKTRASDSDGEPDGEEKRERYIPPTLDENDESILDNTIKPGCNFFDNIMRCEVAAPDWDGGFFETFDEAIQNETILKVLKRIEITNPTPVQKYALKIIMDKRDLVAVAQTGSGKTLAYLLPILQDLFGRSDLPSGYGRPCQEPLAVIICPTRELAKQVEENFFKFTRGTIVKVVCVYGGTVVSVQKAHLSAGCHILIGTPGRLKHMVYDGLIGFSQLKYLVIDEADRMIDDGFLPDIRSIIGHDSMPKAEERQTLMFSATFPEAQHRNAVNEFLHNYVFFAAGIVGGANSDIEQIILKVERSQKKSQLLEVLGSTSNNDRTMVFVDTRKTADYLAAFLSKSGYRSTSIHGDRFQSQREQALRDFRSGKYPVLVATNVAARGLDISGVRHVINYDLPSNIDDYVHRIGRTGRIGNRGKATSFYDPNSTNNKAVARDLLKAMEKCFASIPIWFTEEVGESSHGEKGSDDDKPEDWDSQ